MDQPSAADSCASALGLLLTPTGTVQRHLAAAARDPESLPTLYGALLTGKIYAKDFEVILGVDGPSVDFRSRATTCGPALVVFTSRDRFEHGTRHAEAMPFVYLLELLPDGVGLLVDPEHEAFVASPDDVAMLKRIVR